MVVHYIMKNRESFEPFIEDEVPSDEYCQSMEKDGTWAGNMELQAASLVTHSNICIHRKSSSRWYIKNFSDFDAKMVHLSYHDWEHYNSVRLKDDPCNGPTLPIIIKADADLSVKSHKTNDAVSKTNGRSANDAIKLESIKTVKAGSGCEDEEKIQQVLLQVDGDVDAAIEFIIAGQGTEDYLSENNGVTCSVDDSYGYSKNKLEQGDAKTDEKNVKEKQTCSNAEKETNKTNSLHDEKKIPRNKACPCGSKKKYKSCCGTAAGRPSTVTNNNGVENGKHRKDNKKQGKKAGNVVVLNGCDGTSPDMGALCI
ncbi:OVARIAN TUMOR DOMAIN-containing deubiquitinating enzyme 7-like isoform X2 [Bidens hawaiensis]|uniref:OVARIAN TUMOR DOMAIN-containing deubiquitinating enzyme 7-like isoform X2 n=1 Tax=Bidens hawaiensis TaxID=980011 RepID=UPI004049033E